MTEILSAGDTTATFEPEADFIVSAHGKLSSDVQIDCMPKSIFENTTISDEDKAAFWTALDADKKLSESGSKMLEFRFCSGYICQAKAAAELTENGRVYWAHLTSVNASSALTPAAVLQS